MDIVFLVVSIIVISVVGTLAHFLYDFSKHNKFIGVFAAVNESTWEHIKIALTPTLLWGLVDGFGVHYLSCVGLFAIFGCYMLLTFLPAKNFIFKDPITNKYGFRAHSNKFNIFKRKKK